MKTNGQQSKGILSGLTIVTAILTWIALYFAVPIYSNLIAAELSPVRNWSTSEKDLKGSAVYQSIRALRNINENRIVLLGNSNMHRAIGDPNVLATYLNDKSNLDYQVYNLGTSGQSLVESLAMLETLKPNEKTTIIFGINELHFTAYKHRKYRYRHRIGLPMPNRYLNCSEVKCVGGSLHFYLRRLKMQAVNEAIEVDFREHCEIEREDCTQSFEQERVAKISSMMASSSFFAKDFSKAITRILEQSEAKIVFLITPLNSEFLKLVGNEGFFSEATNLIQSIANEFDIPVIESPGRSETSAKYFIDYGHIKDQNFRETIANHIANELVAITIGAGEL